MARFSVLGHLLASVVRVLAAQLEAEAQDPLAGVWENFLYPQPLIPLLVEPGLLPQAVPVIAEDTDPVEALVAVVFLLGLQLHFPVGLEGRAGHCKPVQQQQALVVVLQDHLMVQEGTALTQPLTSLVVTEEAQAAQAQLPPALVATEAIPAVEEVAVAQVTVSTLAQVVTVAMATSVS